MHRFALLLVAGFFKLSAGYAESMTNLRGPLLRVLNRNSRKDSADYKVNVGRG